jgi:hypothetical protein
MLDQPWADPEIPPLVAVGDDGTVVGFVGVEIRRMRLGERTLRFVSPGHTSVSPAARRHAVGLHLIRTLLTGPQDATLGDSAAPLMEQMWLRLGGRRLDLRAIHWVRVFRPASVAAHLAALRRPRGRAPMHTLASRLDGVLASAAPRLVAPRAVRAADEPLTPPALLAGMRRIERRVALHPAYDADYLEWLFCELGRARRRGVPVARLVHDARGRPIGWYVYCLRPGWRSEVLQVAAAGERDLGTVLDHLFAHAYAHGSAALRGRLEPGMLEALSERRCLLRHRGGTLVHARDPQILSAIESSASFLTRLDSDPWLDTLVDPVP